MLTVRIILMNLVAAICAVALFSSSSFAGAPQFEAAQVYWPGRAIDYVVSSDFDGDGKADLASIGYFATTVSVMLGNGDATFATPTELSTSGDFPTYLFAADIDGDGNEDLLVDDSKQINVFFGAGDGTFANAVTTNSNMLRKLSDLADIDGDGDLDLVSANFSYIGEGSVTVFRNNGTGRFIPAAMIEFDNSAPIDVAIGDFNGDGNKDIATANDDYDEVTLILGNGNFTFQPPTYHSTQTASGTFGERPVSIAAADLDGDGRDDIVTGNNRSDDITVFRSVANGGLAAPIGYLTGSASDVCIVDVNGDGELDVVTSDAGDSTVSILHGVGDGSLEPRYIAGATGVPRNIACADFDGNGLIDFATADSGVAILRNQGNEDFFEFARDIHSVVFNEHTSFADFNNDGICDMLFPATGALQVLPGVGDGTFGFSLASYGTATAIYSGAASADINNDGMLDVVASIVERNRVLVLHGNGDGTFTVPTIGNVGTHEGPRGVVLADFTSDGFADVVTTNWAKGSDGDITLKRNVGNGTFRPPVVVGAGVFYDDIESGDFNNDGNLDILATSDRIATVFLNDGNGRFTSVETRGVFRTRDVAVGDFNKDGNLDFASAKLLFDFFSIHFGNGDGSFGVAQRYDDVVCRDLSVGDLNADGILDLVTIETFSTASIFFGDSNGMFSFEGTFLAGNRPQTVQIKDINGDGAADVAIPHSFAVGVFFNQNSSTVNPTVVNGQLTVVGTVGPDTINVVDDSAGVQVTANGCTFQFSDSITKIVVNSFGGEDMVRIDSSIDACINSGFGNDVVFGGDGINEINGGPGADTIYGGPLADIISAGRGLDFVSGFGGDDIISGGDADDDLFGGAGHDVISGGLGADFISGQAGDDMLIGDAGADLVFGGSGNDMLSGLGGPDELFGGTGNDLLQGGPGYDVLNGGAGVDMALDAGEEEDGVEN